MDSDLIVPQHLLEAVQVKDGHRVICSTRDLVLKAQIKQNGIANEPVIELSGRYCAGWCWGHRNAWAGQH